MFHLLREDLTPCLTYKQGTQYITAVKVLRNRQVSRFA